MTWVDILRSPSCRPLRVVPAILFVLEIRSTKRLTHLFDYSCEPHGVSTYHTRPKQKRHPIGCLFCFGGRGWIRTTEVTDNRFTVCPLWPLGNSPTYKAYFSVGLFGAGGRTRTPDLLITNQLLYQLSYTSEFLTLDYNITSDTDLSTVFCKKY